jgi:NAD dependent epimerase/dehydratase family enzyme
MNERHINNRSLLAAQLTELLLAKGYEVSHLSRKPGSDPRISTYLWDIPKGTIEDKCLDGVDTIMHLAGAGIADKRWTDERKKELIESRTTVHSAGNL